MFEKNKSIKESIVMNVNQTNNTAATMNQQNGIAVAPASASTAIAQVAQQALLHHTATALPQNSPSISAQQLNNQDQKVRAEIIASQKIPCRKAKEADVNQVLSELYIGNKQVLKRISKLSHIRNIFSIRAHPKKMIRKGVNQKEMILSDSKRANLLSKFGEAFSFIEKAKSPVLVHCNGGNSRSAAIITGCLMYRFNVSLKEALHYVALKRPSVHPEKNFITQLQKFEDFLKVHPHKLP